LFNVRRDSGFYNEASKQGIFYAQSWVTAHYLMLSGNGGKRPQFSKFLSLVSSGKPVEDSFRESFQLTYAELERQLEGYIRALAFPILQIKLDQKLDVDRDVHVAAISDALSQYYLGDLLLHMNRLDAAEEHLQRAVSGDPNLGGALSSLGQLKFRQGRDEEARNFLARAVAADSQSYLVHFYYAYMLQRLQPGETQDREARLRLMRTHLKKSIELAPRFVEPYNLLAYVASVLEEELDEAESLLRRAAAAAPGRQDLQLSIIQLMSVNKKAQAARVLVVQLLSKAADDTIRQEAEELLKDVTARVDYERALLEYEERRRAAEEIVVADARQEAPLFDERPVLVRSASSQPQENVLVEPLVTEERPSGRQIEGFLVSMDCSKGATLRLRVGNDVVELHTDTPSQIEFRSYVSSVADSIPCGMVNPEPRVRITYRRAVNPRFLGEPMLIEFIQ
jgi:tetratricopeptide (TPR) repeat protein